MPMDSFFIQKHKCQQEDLRFKIIEWYNTDEDESTDDSDSENEYEHGQTNEMYIMRCFGRTETGKSIVCKISGFKPFYFIKVNQDFSSKYFDRFTSFVKNHFMMKKFKQPLDIKGCCITVKKDIYGFNNEKEYKYVKLTFNSYSAMMKSRYIFKNPITIPGVILKPLKMKLYESNFEPFIRFCHASDIKPAGWVSVKKGRYSETYHETSSQLEITVKHTDILPLPDKYDQANFLQASWDIEVYSHDGTFPLPQVTQNVIFQIATVYKYVKDADTKVQHLLTLKKCDVIDAPNTIVEECRTEKELIKRFVDTISGMDPDILYTYNGDSFDCVYLLERAKKHNLEDYVKSKLSRLQKIPCVMKKEIFSSSAYGDNEYFRLYIPGRLNYDLLIHYKRGMKKYSSYKLDYIAQQVLGQKKHPVGVQEIFDYYKSGDPKKIKVIGEYCIQDCALLQRLVDHHLILESNTQLANVTFVPISFLVTRGQTVKVFSQILRKSTQMGFLVPHTNFNTDTHLITATLYKDVSLEFKSILDKKEPVFVQIHSSKLPRPLHAELKDVSESGKVMELVTNSEIEDLCDCKLVYKGKFFMINRLYNSEDSAIDSFTGATVLEAIPGIYNENIAVLDFASLYPTIMISRNLCFSTFVMKEKYRNIPGVNYERIAWDDNVSYKLSSTCDAIGKSGKSAGVICGKQAFFEEDSKHYCRIHDPSKKIRSKDEKFQKTKVSYDFTIVQPSTCGGKRKHLGVVPALLEELYETRKLVKRQMSKAYSEGDTHLGNVLNSNQMAIKVSLNSTYGFLGRSKGNMIMKELGSIVTSVGRSLIEQSRDYSEQEFKTYLSEHGMLKHTIKVKKVDLNTTEKERILRLFKV